ncbi:MAG TPA: hypothetical protein VF796_21220 [Humisphaera sp.]
MDRRQFLKTAAATASAAGLARSASAAGGPAPSAGPSPQPPNTYQYRPRPDNPDRRKPTGAFTGIQMGPFSLLDEGVDRCLDVCQEAGAVDALLVYSHLYGAGMEVPKEVLADDHGVPVRQPSSRKLPRVWVRHHEEAFGGTALRHAEPRKDDEYAGHDLFAELAEPCRKRGIRLMARVLEPQGAHYVHVVRNWTRGLTVDLTGRLGPNGCWNNPDYRNFWLATAEDLFKTYPLDGFMFGAERVGPLSRVLHRGHLPTCFCRFCAARAKDKGVDPERAKEGFGQLHGLVTALQRSAAPPPDGALAEVLRVILRFPEVLAWEREWAASLEECVALVASTVKTVRPEALVGRHVDHQQTSWDLLYRAAVPTAELGAAVDFVKPATYHDIAAPRVREAVAERATATFLRGVGPEQAMQLYYGLAGLDPAKEPAYADAMTRGFSPDYVFREVRRFVGSAAGRWAVYPGIAMDVPRHAPDGIHRFPTTPESVYEATLKAFEAGADGVMACREYHEMRLPNLRAFGRAVREAAAARNEGTKR